MTFDAIRAICMALPGTTEEVQWGDHLLFKVGGKMYCIADLEPAGGAAFKVGDADFEEISNRDAFKPAPHLARAKWVKVHSLTSLRKSEWEEFIKTSYALVKAKLSKKAQALLDSGD